jgi:hypothetical protein
MVTSPKRFAPNRPTELKILILPGIVDVSHLPGMGAALLPGHYRRVIAVK